jgi:hypothetical protein
MSFRPKNEAPPAAAGGRSLAAVLAAGQLQPTGRGDGSLGPDDGSLVSIPEDHWRRQYSDEELMSDVQYASHKREVLHQLLQFAESMPVKSEYVQRQIWQLPAEIAEETEAIRKTNVEIDRRRADGSWSLM